MRTYVIGIAAFMFIQTVFASVLSISLPVGWRIAYAKRSENVRVIEYIKSNEELNNFSEIITQQIWQKSKALTPVDFHQAIDKEFKGINCQVTTPHDLFQKDYLNQYALIYQCPTQGNKSAVHNGKSGFMVIIDGDPSTFYNIIYEFNEYPLSEGSKQKAIEMINSVKLTK